MAKIISKLSALAVASAKTPGLYGDGGGLYLQVSANGKPSQPSHVLGCPLSGAKPT
jgi:hypothetical protein